MIDKEQYTKYRAKTLAAHLGISFEEAIKVKAGSVIEPEPVQPGEPPTESEADNGE